MNYINTNLKLGSLFDGSGTCPLAATLCGIEPVWASEIEKFPVEVTTKRFPNMKHLGNILDINGAEIEPVDIITFGSPCTNLSVAGKQNGFNITFTCSGDNEKDEEHFTETIRATDKAKYLYEMTCPICGKLLQETNESALFFNAIRIIREMREATNNEYPRFIMWENVPGAFSSNKGSDFKQVLEEITETEIPMPEGGKWSSSGMVELHDRQLAWRVLDAQYWGVPQRRKRIFLVTDFAGQCAGEVLFKPESLFRNFAESREEREGVATDFEGCIDETSECYGVDLYNQCLTGNITKTLNSARSDSDHTPCVCFPINTQIATRHNALGERTGLGIGKNGDPAFTLQEAHSHGVAAFMAGQGSKAGSIGYQEEVSPTLKSAFSGGNTVPSIVTYGFCPDNSITAGGVACEEEKTATLSTTKRLGVVAIENHPADSRVKVDDSGTIGGNVPLILSDQSKTNICESNSTYCLQGNMIGRDDKNGPQGDGINEDVSFTLNATDRHAVIGLDCRNGKENGNLCGTLQAKENGGFSYNCTHPVRIGNAVRRLTPTECARLQGFPDWWCADVPHSDTAEYKMWGNGMALPCVLYIMQNITKVYDKEDIT